MKNAFVLTLFLLAGVAAGQNLDSTQIQTIAVVKDSASAKIPANAQKTIELLDYKNADIKDIIRSLAAKYNLNVFVDDAVGQRATLRLSNISVNDALAFIVKENGLRMTVDGSSERSSIYKIFLPEIPKPKPAPVVVQYRDGLLSLDLKDEDVGKTVHAIAEASKKNIIVNRGAEGRISGFLQNAPFDQGLAALMKSNGFVIRKQQEIYTIDRGETADRLEPGKKTGRNFFVDVKDNLITLEADNADIARIVQEAASQLNANLFVLNNPTGTVSARCSNFTFDNLLDYLFKTTNFTYRKDDDIYIIGGKDAPGIISTKLIPLKYIKAEGIDTKLPAHIKSKANLQVINEHNSLMVAADQDIIRETEDYIRKIDYPVPQVLIEALVVDYSMTDMGEMGISAGLKASQDTSTILDSGLLFPSFDVKVSGDMLNDAIEYHGPKLGIRNVGKLPSNFYMTVKALERKGKANIRSQPQIATLNGNPASIRIGTTQYYQLETNMPIVGGNTAFQQTTQRFEIVKAEISLEITPWVSASGEITTVIKPKFSTPRETFNPRVPPAIDYRELDSTVRLRDGETIVLGGLVNTVDSENVDKLPILGDIPIIKTLFQNKSHNRSKTTLMIYITPHLMYTEQSSVPYEGLTP